MTVRHRTAIAAALAFAAWARPAVAQDPVKVAPTVYKQLLDNARDRVLQVTLKPGTEVATHSHPERTAYVVSGGTLRVIAADGTAKDITLGAGQVIYLPSETHGVKNVGRSTLQLVETELKEAKPSGSLSIEQRAFLLELLERSRRELEELVAATPDELWALKPAPERWSVAEIVEHLSLVEPMLFGMAQQALAQPADPNWALVAGQMTTEQQLGFLANRGQKFQAPEPAQPKGGLTRAEALSRFAGARQVSAEYVRRTADSVDEHVAALPIGRMTVHQLLTMIGGHNLRHNAQITETLAALQKP